MLYRVLLNLSLLIIISACGGGGDDTSNPSSGNDTVPNLLTWNEALFPITSDLKWTYNTNPNSVSTQQVIKSNTNVTQFSFPSGGREYYSANNSGLDYLGFYVPIIRIAETNYSADVWFSQGINIISSNQKTIEGRGTVNISPQFGNRDMDYQVTKINLGEENITVPFGTFLATRLSISVVATVNIEGSSISIRLDNELWLVENIGVVRRRENANISELVKFTGNDADNDGLLNLLDIFPNDPSEQIDTDLDGIGDNKDSDDDNDGVPDQQDDAPTDPLIQRDVDENGIDDYSDDADGDGVPNDIDTDDDGDGISDLKDAFPLNSKETLDNDIDGIGDNEDNDDDNDGTIDSRDVFPFDPFETKDLDQDGIGDNADIDIDGDGAANTDDHFPLDLNEQIDTDLDGIGNNADLDDDGDWILDPADYYPLVYNHAKEIYASGAQVAVLYEGNSVISFGPDDLDYPDRQSSVDLSSGVVRVVPFPTVGLFSFIKDSGSIITCGYSACWTEGAVIHTEIVDISTTQYGAAALLEDGSVVTWGRDDMGGNSSEVDLSKNIKSIQGISTYDGGTKGIFIAQKEDNSYIAWGNQKSVRAINTVLTNNVIKVVGFSYATHFALLKNDGTTIITKILPSGANYSDSIEDVENIFSFDSPYGITGKYLALLKKDKTLKIVPEIIADIQNLENVYVGGNAVAAITTEGQLHTFGDPNRGGDSSLINTASGIKSIYPSIDNFFVESEDGMLDHWGKNICNYRPIDVSAGIVEIVTSSLSNFAIHHQDGTVTTLSCDNLNQFYFRVDSTSDDVKMVAGGSLKGFVALKNNGQVIFWGADTILKIYNSINQVYVGSSNF